MTENIKAFPEGIALGDAFINREAERKHLIKRIKTNLHTVLLAPRRYGKTSLVIKVANEVKIPYCSIDFLAAYNEEYVRDQIISKVSRLVFQLLPRARKAKEKLIQIFQQMKPEIVIGAFGQRLSLKLSNNPLQDITDLLLKLDETAKHFKKRAVVFMDEFQQISQLKNYHSIEASIRHAVERSENIAYVFSGSNRNQLKQMFGSEDRPLFRLCQTMTIERMDKEVYATHLNKLARRKWKTTLPANALEQIFTLTELHPFYMNVLCQLLWDNENVFSNQDVSEIWHNYVKTQKHIISHNTIELSINQRRIITALANAPVKEIQSAAFTSQLKISASSAQQAIEFLMRKDLIYKDNEGLYRVLDPAIRYYLDVIIWDDL